MEKEFVVKDMLKQDTLHSHTSRVYTEVSPCLLDWLPAAGQQGAGDQAAGVRDRQRRAEGTCAGTEQQELENLLRNAGDWRPHEAGGGREGSEDSLKQRIAELEVK